MKLSPEQSGELLAAAAASKKFDRTPTNTVFGAVDNLKAAYVELFSVLPSEQDWATRLASWARLNIPSSHSAAATTDTFVAQFYLETGLLALLESGVLKPVITTPESEDDIAKLRKSIAAYRKVLFHEEPAAADTEPDPSNVPAQTQPSGPTEAELDACVINDWRTLPTSEVRARCRDAAYKTRLDRLMTEGKI